MMEEALVRLRGAKKYADVCPDTLDRVLAEAFSRHKKPKDAEKAAREALHAITGAFMGPDELKKARELLLGGDAAGALRLHASTRERMPLDAFYGALWGRIGKPRRVLDLACGMNPVYLASVEIDVLGADISGAQARLVNEWAQAAGVSARVEVRDLLCPGAVPKERFDAALAMKLLPVLETQKKGAASALLHAVNAACLAVTFPTRTLGGRSVGMERYYSEWFEALEKPDWTIEARYVLNGELVYLLKEARNAEAVRGGDAHRESE
jgi:16S rRNA (guanine(1405)-N(7))-methyltransferase